jgi:hypothetical protein
MLMKNSSVVKSLAVAVLLGGASLFSTGCAKTGLEYDFLAPPGYSMGENFQRQGRNAQIDQNQLIEDFDKDVTMSRPASELTKWHVRTTD